MVVDPKVLDRSSRLSWFFVVVGGLLSFFAQVVLRLGVYIETGFFFFFSLSLSPLFKIVFCIRFLFCLSCWV